MVNKMGIMCIFVLHVGTYTISIDVIASSDANNVSPLDVAVSSRMAIGITETELHSNLSGSPTNMNSSQVPRSK